MKTLILLAALYTTLIVEVDAQPTSSKTSWTMNNVNIRIGAEFASAIGQMTETYTNGFGGSALLDIPVLPRLSLIFYGGAIDFTGDVIQGSQETRYKRLIVIPIKTGVNYRLTKSIYASGQLGQSIIKYPGEFSGGFSQSVGIGYFKKYLDIGARWDHYSAFGGFASINLKLAYAIQLGVQK